MGLLIAIEGVDGAGKFTLSHALAEAWEAEGIDVVRFGFPRYGESVHADIAAEALGGDHGDLASSVHAMAVLFALDRHGAATDLRRLIARHDVVLLDRYVASNAAYTAARLGEGADGDAVQWVRDLEFGRLAVPVPDAQIFLGVPTAVAGERARRREEADSTRTRDVYERDSGLQERTAAVYADLAEQSWCSKWHVVDGSGDAAVDPAGLAAALLNER
jgi:dTMP kinase